MTSKAKVSLMALFGLVSLSVYGWNTLYFSSENASAAGISNASVSLQANSVGNYDGNVTFTIDGNIGNMMGNKLVITAPQEFSNLVSSQLTCQWLADGTTTGSQMSSKYSLTIMSDAISSGEKTCRLDALKSPSSIYNGKTSGTWKIEFANVGGASIFSATAPGVCIGACTGTEPAASSPSSSPSSSSSSSPSSFTDPISATLSDSAAKATSIATFKFKTTNAFGIPSYGKVEYIFPSGFILPSSASALKTACGGATKLGILSISGQKITLKKTETDASPPVTLTCQFSGITNPSSEGKTGDFTFTIIDSTGAIKLETKTDVPGVTITAAKVESVSAAPSTDSTQQQTSTEQKSTDTTLHSAPEAEDPLAKKLRELEEKLKAKEEAAKADTEAVAAKKAADQEAKRKRLSELEKKLSENVPEEVKEKLGTAEKTKKVKEKKIVAVEEEEEEESSITEGLIDEELFETDYTALSVKELKSEKRKLSIGKKDVIKAFKEETLAAVDEEEKQDLQIQLKAILKQFKTAQKNLDKETKKKKKVEKAAKKKKK